MSRLLVTGADGFVGRWLVREALSHGHDVVAAIGPGGAPPATWLPARIAARVATVPLDLTDLASVGALAGQVPAAVVHLAALSSGAAARRDPAAAHRVNAEGTRRLLTALGALAVPPRCLVVSTGEVYGAGHDGPISESAPLAPVSPYAESKVAAEAAAHEAGVAHGVPVVVARAFPHTGPGQSTDFVLPAFAARLAAARDAGARTFPVGNLDVVRDFLDVRDVVRAYLLLLERGEAGTAYNVASGTGQHLAACVRRLAELVGTDAEPTTDPALVRPADIPVLVGDPARLHAATGWYPFLSFDQTLQDLVDAQAH